MSFNVAGYRLKDPDPFTFLKALAPFRPKIAKVMQAQVALVYAQTITHLVDDPMGNGDPAPSSPYWRAREEIKKERDEIISTGRRNPRMDFEFKIALQPFEGQTYARVFCEHREWIKKLEALKLMTEFNYWDSTDRPKSKTKAEWEERYRIWSALCGPAAPQFIETLTVNLEPPEHYFQPSRKEIKDAIVSYEDRLNRVAINRVVHRHMVAEHERTGKDLSDGFGSFFAAHDWVKTDAGKVEVALEKAHQRTMLLPEIPI